MNFNSHGLKEERIFQSMSHKDNCYNNAVMENFFGLLKPEIYYSVVYYSFEELQMQLKKYIKYYHGEYPKVCFLQGTQAAAG